MPPEFQPALTKLARDLAADEKAGRVTSAARVLHSTLKDGWMEMAITAAQADKSDKPTLMPLEEYHQRCIDDPVWEGRVMAQAREIAEQRSIRLAGPHGMAVVREAAALLA